MNGRPALDALALLDVIIREGSVTRAALEVGLSQPAVSNALARLRQELGDPLLVRTPDGMTPTPRALELVGPVRRALAELAPILEARPPFHPATSRASFQLAATDHVALLVLPRLARVLQRDAPGVELSLVPWRGEPTYEDVAA